jgi:Zn ribbon nucleic-acid-binding protein
MGLLQFFRRNKDIMCPECEKAQKHVRMVETDGKTVECPECHYAHIIRR